MGYSNGCSRYAATQALSANILRHAVFLSFAVSGVYLFRDHPSNFQNMLCPRLFTNPIGFHCTKDQSSSNPMLLLPRQFSTQHTNHGNITPTLLNPTHTNPSTSPSTAYTCSPYPDSPFSSAHYSSRNNHKTTTPTAEHPQAQPSNDSSQEQDAYTTVASAATQASARDQPASRWGRSSPRSCACGGVVVRCRRVGREIGAAVGRRCSSRGV